jgi:hypothetical protein
MQYRLGTATVTNGSATVTLTGATTGADAVAVGNAWKSDLDGDGIYQIASRTPGSGASITSLTLTTTYGGSNASGIGYQITKDFTTLRNYPEVSQGDHDAADWITKALRMIGTDIYQLLGPNAGRPRSPIQTVTMSSTTNNLAISASYGTVKLGGSPGGAVSFTGMTAGNDGDVVLLLNTCGNTITIARENASSTAANRFASNSAANLTLHAGGGAAFCLYSTTTNRWHVLAGAP